MTILWDMFWWRGSDYIVGYVLMRGSDYIEENVLMEGSDKILGGESDH